MTVNGDFILWVLFCRMVVLRLIYLDEGDNMTITIKYRFLNAIAENVFLDKNGKMTIEKDFFYLRYSPDNQDLNNKNLDVNKPSICKLLADKGCGDVSNTIQKISRSVIDCLLAKYGEEIENDLGMETVNLLKKPGRGRSELGKDLWKVIYEWLWEHKFLLWLEEIFWLYWESMAAKNRDWIDFQDDEDMKIGQVSSGKLKIPKVEKEENEPLKLNLEKPYWVIINFPDFQGYLLLLNHGVVSCCLVCPSLAFAVDSRLKETMLLPQKESLSYQQECRFTFEELGMEKFVAIALEKPLDLAWLKPNEEEAAPELTGKRMKELWEELEKQDNWRVYFQEVEVVGEVDNGINLVESDSAMGV